MHRAMLIMESSCRQITVPAANERKKFLMTENEIIDRETYRKIKKMNRDELTKFILRYGTELTGSEERVIDLSALQSELGNIKGIGEKRLEEIMSVIEKFLNV